MSRARRPEADGHRAGPAGSHLWHHRQPPQPRRGPHGRDVLVLRERGAAGKGGVCPAWQPHPLDSGLRAGPPAPDPAGPGSSLWAVHSHPRSSNTPHAGSRPRAQGSPVAPAPPQSSHSPAHRPDSVNSEPTGQSPPATKPQADGGRGAVERAGPGCRGHGRAGESRARALGLQAPSISLSPTPACAPACGDSKCVTVTHRLWHTPYEAGSWGPALGGQVGAGLTVCPP